MKLQTLVASALALGLTTATPTPTTTIRDVDNADNWGSGCKVLNFTVSGSALNRNITGIEALLGNATAFLAAVTLDLFPKIEVNGSQTLSGVYCTPKVKNYNNSKLQVFFHSIVGNRGGFSALGDIESGLAPVQPEKYSWTDYANKLGYPTLNIDRLGNGFSSHPDPILVVQGPYEDALYHDLAKQIRAGSTGTDLPQYSYLIWVGNSYGSQLGSTSAQKFPTDWDEYILTGFSRRVDLDILGVTLVVPAPAPVASPTRFGNIAVGYLVPTSRQGQINSFFGSPAQVSFDPAVGNLFFDRNDVVSIGQFVSVYAPPQTATAPGYKGRVFDLTGEQDQAFCGPGSPVLGPAGCGTALAEAGTLFPAADYNWRAVNSTGHAIQLANSAQTVFAIAHQFLAGASFKGGIAPAP